MKKYTMTLHVDLPPETVFDAVVDPEFQSGRFMKVEVVEETPEVVGTKFRYEYRVLGMHLGGGTFTYSEYVPNRRFTWEFSGGADMLLMGGPVSSTWTFEPADGGTDITATPRFKTLIPGVNQLARGIMMWSWRTRDLPKFVAEIEKRTKAKTKVGARA